MINDFTEWTSDYQSDKKWTRVIYDDPHNNQFNGHD